MANTQGIKAGRAYVELGVGDKLTAGMKRAQAVYAGGAQGSWAKPGDGSFCFDTRDGILRFYNRRRWRLVAPAAPGAFVPEAYGLRAMTLFFA